MLKNFSIGPIFLILWSTLRIIYLRMMLVYGALLQIHTQTSQSKRNFLQVEKNQGGTRI